ncbi:hypothetical protein T310_6181, partial [Rasamsonia emersonii CBS 393.64]
PVASLSVNYLINLFPASLQACTLTVIAFCDVEEGAPLWPIQSQKRPTTNAVTSTHAKRQECSQEDADMVTPPGYHIGSDKLTRPTTNDLLPLCWEPWTADGEANQEIQYAGVPKQTCSANTCEALLARRQDNQMQYLPCGTRE